MEQEQREETGAARSQHVVHVMPRDNVRAARLIAAVAARASAAAEGPELVVVAPSADDVLAVAAALGSEGQAGSLLPVTSARRAKRMLAQAPAAIAGTPKELVQLLGQAALKLSAVRTVVLLWVDELLDVESRSGLEALLADVPRDAARIFTSTVLTDAVEEFLQGFMWRARRVTHAEPAGAAQVPLRYMPVSDGNRWQALRTILDAFDPGTAGVVVFTPEGEAEGRRAATLLGYRADDSGLRIGIGVPETDAELLVVFEEVPNADVLRELTARSPNVIALVSPSRLHAFRAIAGPAATPLTFTGAFQAARASEDVLRDELRGIIQGGAIASQILQLEPLCEEHDPVEIAAAALFLVHRERQRARRSATPAATAVPTPAPASAAATSGFTRIFLNVGERDGARRGDIVGAITGEAGIVGTQIGKIDLRDAHTIVEVLSDVAGRVIERLNGTSIRGRRVVAREDRERDAGPRSRGEEGRGHAPRRPREGGRGTGHRGGRGETRGGARGGGDKLPRAAREREEWAERGERLRHARGRGEGDDA